MISPALPPPLNGTNVVTASDLVRHFGHWQERASREPVYVLHRGRPRFVLTSMETMHALCAPHQSAPVESATPGIAFEPLLDLTREIILLVDHDLALIATSRAARGYFGEGARTGVPLANAVRSASSALLVDAVRRVMASGIGEKIDIAAPYAGRSVVIAIDAIESGAFLQVRDITLVEELAALRAEQAAVFGALMVTGKAAIGRINLRGYLEPPLGGIATLVGLESATLLGSRFIALIDSATRPTVGQALENAIETRQPVRCDAALLISGAPSNPISIAFNPIRRGSVIEGVSVAVIVL
ncbi:MULTISPECIES: hypothetical protein [unclassified Sphingomonas]|uniref:hypothetical protein n=1 Tax=unclassified Sphingomonas TaxID=196159 RepID=UPI000BC5AB08|nr:MAG: hypothetical protein B7Z43_10275 [Sphingomonas sp. 12-62-6]OYX37078.1 MAG: hypothetical protein B7Y98_13555 [Sphingomonas sp. 32-62-10]